MPSRRALAVALAVTLGALTGCAGDGAGTPGASATPAFDAIADPGRVPVLLRQELGEDVTVRRMTLSGSGFTTEVRDPAKPQNLDRYTYYNATWDTEPVSVNQSEIDALGRTTFGIGEVAWRAIPRLERKALAGLDLEGEEITSVSIDRLDGQPQPRIYVSVSGDRGSGALLATGRGKITDIRRH